MPCCAITHCKNNSTLYNVSRGGISYHRFPKDGRIKEQWINVTGRTNWMPTKTSTICSEHFTENDFIITKKEYRYLKTNAVPTVNVLLFVPKYIGSIDPNCGSTKRQAVIVSDIDSEMQKRNKNNSPLQSNTIHDSQNLLNQSSSHTVLIKSEKDESIVCTLPSSIIITSSEDKEEPVISKISPFTENTGMEMQCPHTNQLQDSQNVIPDNLLKERPTPNLVHTLPSNIIKCEREEEIATTISNRHSITSSINFENHQLNDNHDSQNDKSENLSEQKPTEAIFIKIENDEEEPASIISNGHDFKEEIDSEKQKQTNQNNPLNVKSETIEQSSAQTIIYTQPPIMSKKDEIKSTSTISSTRKKILKGQLRYAGEIIKKKNLKIRRLQHQNRKLKKKLQDIQGYLSLSSKVYHD